MKVKCIECHYFGIHGLGVAESREVKQKERGNIQAGKIENIPSVTVYCCERGKWSLTGDGISKGYEKELFEERSCALFDVYSPGVDFAGRRAETEATESSLSLKIAKWALGLAGFSLIIAVIAIIQNCVSGPQVAS